MQIGDEEESSGDKEEGGSIEMITYLQCGRQTLPFTYIPGTSCEQVHTPDLMTMCTSSSTAPTALPCPSDCFMVATAQTYFCSSLMSLIYPNFFPLELFHWYCCLKTLEGHVSFYE